MDKTDFTKLRNQMVDRQVASRGVRTRRVLDALRAVPREAFVPQTLRDFAYEDTALVVADDQTLPQPAQAALMIDALALQEGETVLEAGTGTGYTAAVLSRLASTVYTVEPSDHAAMRAATTLTAMGRSNVHVLHANPVLGWPEHAPFDAILVNAVGPQVPISLRHQLRIGGRLVMPLGRDPNGLEVVRVTRVSETAYRTEDMADVRLTTLIGVPGPAGLRAEPSDADGLRLAAAPEASAVAPGQGISRGPTPDATLAAAIASAAQPFVDVDSADLAPLIQRIGDARVVLLGEATHGTSEFYRLRDRITRELIEKKDFSFVAIEGDWPDAARIDHHVRDVPSVQVPPSSWSAFARFPTWMWRNEETRAFVDWLREHNAGAAAKVSFHGLDLYSLNHSIRAVLDYLDQVDPASARVARARYACLSPWQRDPAAYGQAALSERYASCEREVVATLSALMRKRGDYAQHDGPRFLDALQNARLVANAERYYRSMYYGSRTAWNLRDGHMFETLKQLLKFHGPQSKCVVWAHNSHVGNSAATEMALRGEYNLGHLCRNDFGADACLIGFGTHRGTVAAASEWDAPMEVKTVRESLEGSFERLFHSTGIANFILPLREPTGRVVLEGLTPSRLQRAIGVIYRPQTERQSHYFQTLLTAQFDEYIWLDETHAVTPLKTQTTAGSPDTYPFGL